MATNKPDKPTYKPLKQMKPENREPLPEKSTQPAPNPAAIKNALEAARTKLMETFNAFHKVLFNKKLAKNKSEQEKTEERQIADGLFRAAGELDQVNGGEGTMVVGTIGIRELLKMRDRLNEIEYTTLLTRKELNELKEALGEKKT